MKLLAACAFVAAACLVAWKADVIVDHVLDLRYGRTLARPAYAPPRNAAEANLQDLDYLARLPTVDRSFTPGTAAEFARRVRSLRENAATLDSTRMFLGIAEAVAVADNAHTNVDLGAWREHLNSVPVRLAWFAEGLYVVRAMAPHAALLGARVVAIDGRDPSELEGEAARFIGGTPEHAHAASTLLLESPQALNALHPEAPADRLLLRLDDGGGTPRTVELPAVAPADASRATRPGRLLSTALLAREKPGEWKTLLDPAAQAPPSLRDPMRRTYSTRLAPGVLYLHLWRVSEGFDPEVGQAIDAALGASGEPRWQRIVLDLRFNDGGEYPTIYRAIRALPGRLAADGRLVILTDNTTFSGAIITAALARHFAGARATILGEKAGDRLAFWAEGNSIELPNAKLRVNTSTGYHDWARGCRELRCYWPNFFHDVAVGSIDPDIPSKWLFSDYRRGIDTVLMRALE